MIRIQELIGEFSNKTFPNSDEISKFNHLVREIREFGKSCLIIMTKRIRI